MVALVSYIMALYLGWKIGEMAFAPIQQKSRVLYRPTQQNKGLSNGVDFLYKHPEAQ